MTRPVAPIAVVLDVHEPEVRAVIAGECPASIELRMATSGSPEERRALAQDAAFFIGLHVPYTEATRRMLSRERIARLRPGAIVINTARGEVVDEVALAEALAAGHLGGAGLDVFGGEPPAADHPLLGLRVPGLVLAPHVAGSVFDNVANVARHAFRNIQRVLDGQSLPAADLVAPPAEPGGPADEAGS